ncbi:MAG: hypothetical protein E7404_03825 [Ruminococcaceae bacterium]|nr:hypothetical protein [Oscillospiraceae bacterium]
MMKNGVNTMKKAIVFLLILTLIPIYAFADGEVFLEDVESYSDTITPITITIDDNTSKQLGETDWWMIKGTSGNPLNAGKSNGVIVYPTLSVVEEDGNKAFNLTGGSGDYSSYIERRQAARYMGNGLANINNNYKLEYDFEKSQTKSTICFQFMIHNGGKNYYIVNIAGEKTGGAPVWTVAKIVDNAVVGDVVVKSPESYSSPTSSPGAVTTTKGHVSIISDGNGVITVTLTGKRYGESTPYSSTLTLADSEPFDIDAKDTTIGFFVGTTQTNSQIDNIAIYDVEEFVDYEPGTILYKNVSDKANINEFEEAVVRRISSASLANKKVEVVFEDESTSKTYEASFDAKGKWVNLVDSSMFTKVTLPEGNDYSDLAIYAIAEENPSKNQPIKSEAVHYFPKLRGEMGNDKFTWESSDENVATVDKGVVKGIRAGSATITATYKGASLSYDVVVKGEYDYALEEDKLDEYFASKKPVFDEINNALNEDDASKLKAVLTNTGEIKIESVPDINVDILSETEDAEIEKLVNNLISYDGFSFASLEDFKTFEDAVELELDVIKFENINDTLIIDELLLNNNELLKLDTENEFFERFNEKCVVNLLNKEYDNYDNLKKYFADNIVLSSYKEMISYSDVEDLCNKNQSIIGYDTTHYEEVKCSDMFTQLIYLKSTIDDVSDIKDFIDTYTKPVQQPSYSSGSSGGSKGGGGGGSIKFTPKYEADTEYVKEAEKETASEVSKEKETIYKDLEKGTWYEDYILKLAGKNIMNGNNGYIKPLDNITRAEFVKMLVLATGTVLGEEDACQFDDVSENDWFYDYVASGYVNSIVVGNGNMFYPNSNISREEIAVLVDRAINNLGIDVKSDSMNKMFADEENISEWAYASVIRCSSYGIINGYSDSTFVPAGFATRAESAKMLSCLIEIIDEAAQAASETQQG